MTAITIPNTFLPSTTISSTAMNANFTEVADAIGDSMAIDGSDTLTGQLRAANGTAAAPGVSFGADLNIGMYRKAADELGFATAGVLAFHLDSAAKGWFAAGLDIATDLDVGDDLTVDGDATLTGNVTVGGTLGVTGVLTAQAATEGTAGLVDMATDAEIRAATSGAHAVMAEDLETAAAAVALTDQASIALDWDTGINFTVTLGGNRTLANPTNGQPGTWRRVQITQDGTGSRTLAYGNQYVHPGGSEPVLTTTAAAVDVLYLYCRTASIFEVYVGGYAWAA
jgi:hypothetical protein